MRGWACTAETQGHDPRHHPSLLQGWEHRRLRAEVVTPPRCPPALLLTLPRRTACSRWRPRRPGPCASTWRPPCASGPSACRRPRSPRGWRTGCPHLLTGGQSRAHNAPKAPRKGFLFRDLHSEGVISPSPAVPYPRRTARCWPPRSAAASSCCC